MLAFRLEPYFIDIEKSFELQFPALDSIESHLKTESSEIILLGARKSLLFPVFPDANIYGEFRFLPPDLARHIAHVMYGLERNRRAVLITLELAEKSPSILPKFIPRHRQSLEKHKADFDGMRAKFAKEYWMQFEQKS